MVAASLLVGSQPLAPDQLVRALEASLGLRDGAGLAPDAVNIAGLRLVRTLLGLLVGAGLGVGGVLIQAVTRNPVAEPGILGINAGASFAVALAVSLDGAGSARGQSSSPPSARSSPPPSSCSSATRPDRPPTRRA